MKLWRSYKRKFFKPVFIILYILLHHIRHTCRHFLYIFRMAKTNHTCIADITPPSTTFISESISTSHKWIDPIKPKLGILRNIFENTSNSQWIININHYCLSNRIGICKKTLSKRTGYKQCIHIIQFRHISGKYFNAQSGKNMASGSSQYCIFLFLAFMVKRTATK